MTTWLARGQNAAELTSLTGRTDFWHLVLDLPRTRFQEIFGFGLSNGSIDGLPIDSNWLVAYLEQGLFGVIVCAVMLLFLLVAAFFQPSGTRRALALFLITYCLVGLVHPGRVRQPHDIPPRTHLGRVVAGAAGRSERAGMKVVLMHNRSASAACRRPG